MDVKTAPRLRRFLRPDALVAAGILASRLAGLVRTYLISYFFGLKADAVDAFYAAFRIPNLLQNLFGEGALSGSFIPVHAALHARGQDREASQMARTSFALLMLVISILVLVGELATPLLVDTIAYGFDAPKRELTARLVRVLFPGAGLLVSAAWCLGVLNSHGKFLLSYASGVAWNAGMIAALLIFGGHTSLDGLALYLAWGSVVGSLLQFSVQAPMAFTLTSGGGRLALSEPVRQAVRDFLPVLVSRGAVQLSAYIDGWIASFLPMGAVAGLGMAQQIYTLPVSLFGISVSAAELPALSKDAARETTDVLRQRIDAALARLAFFVVPSAIAFAALGDMISAVLLEHGHFKHADSLVVWSILVGAAVGLLASTQARLYSVAHYAVNDTRTPLGFALIRLTAVTILGYISALVLPGRLGIDEMWGAAGLTASAGVAGWIEFALLRHSMHRKIGPTGVPPSLLARLWASGLIAAGLAWIVKLVLPIHQPIIRGIVVLGVFGGCYLALTMAFHVPGVRSLVRSVRRKPS